MHPFPRSIIREPIHSDDSGRYMGNLINAVEQVEHGLNPAITSSIARGCGEALEEYHTHTFFICKPRPSGRFDTAVTIRLPYGAA